MWNPCYTYCIQMVSHQCVSSDDLLGDYYLRKFCYNNCIGMIYPHCFSICIIRSIFRESLLLIWLQWCTLSPVCAILYLLLEKAISHWLHQTGKYGLFRPEMEGAKDLTQEPRSAKIEKYFPGAPVRSAFNITCLAGSAAFREILIYPKVNTYFT